MRHFLVLIWSLCALSLSTLYAQSSGKADIYGIVRENVDNGFRLISRELPGATVQLVTSTDTLYTTTNIKGVFLFKDITPQKVHLKLFMLGKSAIEGEYEIESGRNAFYFTMDDAKEQLKSAKVTAESELSSHIADTTVYNVKLLKTLESESARALLEQLPGFSVSNDRISIDGQEVKRTYVNGVLVFGDHPVTAVDAIKADEVTQVNVYDELSPEDKRRGLIQGKKERVIDIKTKTKIVSLTDAVILAEGGADQDGQLRYQGLGAAAFWSEMFTASAMAAYDNLSGSLHEDAYKSLVPMELAKTAQVHSVPRNSISENITTSLEFEKYWKDRAYGNKLKGSYTYGRKHLKTASNALTQYYPTNDNPEMSYYDTTSSVGVTNRHKFIIHADLHDTPLKSISLFATGTIDDDTQTDRNIERIVSDKIRLRQESAQNKRGNQNIALHAGWTDNDIKTIIPAIDLTAEYSRENRASWIVDTMATSYNRRRLTTEGCGNGLRMDAVARLSYKAFNDDKHSLLINGRYDFRYRNITKKQMSIDSLDVTNPIISIGSTFDYTWKDIDNSFTLSASYATGKFAIDGGLSLTDEIVLGDDRFPKVAPINKHYFSVLPRVVLKYDNFNFQVSTQAITPAQEQIRCYINDTNPMVLTAGNPLLKKSYMVDGQLIWTLPLKTNGGRVMLNASGNCLFNSIVSHSTYFKSDTVLPEYFDYMAPAGSILYSFANSSIPAWTIRASASYWGLLLHKKLLASPRISGSFERRPQYVGNDVLGVNDTHLSMSAQLRYSPSRKLRITLNPSLLYWKSYNDLQQTLSESLNTTASLMIRYSFLKHGFADLHNRFGYSHYISGSGKDITSNFLSATIGWRFLKNSLSVSITGNDLLNASTNYTTETTAQYFREKWTPNYGRYFLLSVVYEFRKNK